jgi:hypothetical protein
MDLLDKKLYDYWNPKFLIDLCDSKEEALVLTKLLFKSENQTWSEDQINYFFSSYQFDINLEKILNEK